MIIIFRKAGWQKQCNRIPSYGRMSAKITESLSAMADKAKDSFFKCKIVFLCWRDIVL